MILSYYAVAHQFIFAGLLLMVSLSAIVAGAPVGTPMEMMTILVVGPSLLGPVVSSLRSSSMLLVLSSCLLL